MLRSARELVQSRVQTAEGHACGRIKDLYFDDCSWQVSHLVLSIEPIRHGRKELLIDPAQIAGVHETTASVRLSIVAAALGDLPMATSVRPVCKQYEAFAYASPGARKFASVRQSNPHLRSLRAVLQCRVEAAGDFSGNLADLIYDSDGWDIRYAGIEQSFDRKAVRFFIVPQAIERITWATRRIVLRELRPVSVGLGKVSGENSAEAAA